MEPDRLLSDVTSDDGIAITPADIKMQRRSVAAAKKETSVLGEDTNVLDMSSGFTEADVKRMQEVKWGLVLSSATFCIPAVLTFFRTPWLWWLMVSYTTTSIVSINYWRDPMPGARRNADIYTAHSSFVITCVAGGLFVRDPFWLFVGWPLAAMIPFFYWLSIKLFSRGGRVWALAHMSMHACISVGMSIVVAGATEPK